MPEPAAEVRTELDEITYAVGDTGVALITLNRPHRLNALTPTMRTSYLQALARAGRDDNVGAVVVTGAGRAFCAGADFKVLDDADGAMIRARHKSDSEPVDMARRIPKPVIAAINGPAAGVGFAHALLADIRFAAHDAKITTTFARLGLVAEAGTSWILPRLVGTARALDLLWSSRVITGDEAFEYGIVQAVHPVESLLDESLRYASELVATSSAYSMRRMKEQVQVDWTTSWDTALGRAIELTAESFDRPEFAQRAKR